MTLLREIDIVGLPITDIQHVVYEINWWRQYTDIKIREQRRRSAYMQKYNAKKRNYERREQDTTAGAT
jgi:hypothetical protein